MYLYVHKPIASKTHFFGGGCQKKSMVKLWEITGTKKNASWHYGITDRNLQSGVFEKTRCLKIFSKTVFFRFRPPKQWVKGAIGT